MTKSIIQLANEAHLYDDDQEPLVQHLEAFAAAIKAEHLEELAGVEMPEPCVASYDTIENNDGAFLCFTLDQCQQAVAAVVARERAGMPRIADEYNALVSQCKALTAELAKKDAEHQQEDALLDEIDNLLEPVDYKGSYAEGIKALTAERDKANQSSAHWQHKYTEVTVERDRLREALELALAHGSFEQGSGVIHNIRAALEATK